MRRMIRYERGRRQAVRLAVVMGLLLTPLGVQAQQTSPEETQRETPARRGEWPIELTKVREFLFAAYPELIGRDLALTMRRENQAVLVSIVDQGLGRDRAGVGPGDVAGASVAPPIVTARFEFGAGAQLRRFDGYGPLLHEGENLALQDELVKNPRWIESDADVWLTTRGATSTFAAPSPTVVTRTGAVAERMAAQAVGGARFEWHTGHTSAAGGRVFRSRPAWVTEAVGVDANGAALIYQFEYEPFGGRLIAVTVLEAQ
jgi:hypothetical protein